MMHFDLIKFEIVVAESQLGKEVVTVAEEVVVSIGKAWDHWVVVRLRLRVSIDEAQTHVLCLPG